MEDQQLEKIQRWFETLGKQVKKGFDSIREEMATKQQVENRYQALLTAITNLHRKIENYKDQTDQEITLIKRALHDLEEEVKIIRKSISS